MPRAIDFHVHLPISEFMDVAIGKYRQGRGGLLPPRGEAAERSSRSPRTTTIRISSACCSPGTLRRPRASNPFSDTVAELCAANPRQFVGFASVDPYKGEWAINEMERAVKSWGFPARSSTPASKPSIPTIRGSARSSTRSRS